MPNQKNIQILESIKEKFPKARGIYFTDYKGLNVQEMTDLRKELYAANIEYMVAKKTLMKIAAKNSGFDLVDEILNGQIALAISYTDPNQPGKVINNFIKKNKLNKLAITGCVYDGVLFGANQVEVVINLPSRQQLMATLASSLSVPMSKLTGVLRATMGRLVGTLNSLNDAKKQS
ncbi:MAG: 50S ribosomal protein L10 [Candidatus Neomarinimicrobiota bacterium]